MENSNNKTAAFVCRICPMHLGHEAVIRQMLKDFGPERSLIIIGSSNAPISMRAIFPYDVRRDLLLRVFPEMSERVAGLPDYFNDQRWMLALDDLLRIAKFDPASTVFYGGCDEDVRFFRDAKRECIILNRFNGTTPKISATEVRDALIEKRSLDGLMNPIIIPELEKAFAKYWNELKQK